MFALLDTKNFIPLYGRSACAGIALDLHAPAGLSPKSEKANATAPICAITPVAKPRAIPAPPAFIKGKP